MIRKLKNYKFKKLFVIIIINCPRHAHAVCDSCLHVVPKVWPNTVPAACASEQSAHSTLIGKWKHTPTGLQAQTGFTLRHAFSLSTAFLEERSLLPVETAPAT